MKKLLILIVFMSSAIVNAQTTWQSALVQLNTTTGELSYTAEPVSGVKIPDFSRAGYRGGGVPLPTVPVKMSISPISGDNTAHIQNAIDAVSAMPLDASGFRGAVLLNSGAYRVDGTLEITTSGVVLRGTGRSDNISTNTHLLGLGDSPSERTIIKMGGLDNTKFEGEVSGSQTDIISPLVEVGDKKFVVADASSFQVGDNIIIRHPCTQEWIDALDGGGTGSDPDWEVGDEPIIYNTRIEKIRCDTIYINSPVFSALNLSLSQSYIYKYDRDGLVENVGLENLRIDIEYDHSDPTDKDHAKRAVELSLVENAWVSGCEFLHFYYAGIELETSNYVTISDCHALEPKGPTSGGYKYNFNLSTASQNILFTNCVASEARHAFVSNGASTVAGIVFHKCTSISPLTSSEGHRRWTTGLLFDCFRDTGDNPGRVISLINRGSWGTGHGWSSANSVVWNSDVTRPGTDGKIVVQRPPTAQNFAIGCKGIVTGVGPYQHPAGYIEGSNNANSLLPNSLYDGQLASRNYLDSVSGGNSGNNPCLGYCTSTYTNSGSEFISNVQFNTINNTSGDAGSSGYEDFTVVSTTVSQGGSYAIAVTINTAGNYTDYCQVFFDWNFDGDFSDAGEMVDLGDITNVTAGVLSGTVTVPASATIGSTRMRVNIEYNFSPGPCDLDHTSEWGETEDYSVDIVNASVDCYGDAGGTAVMDNCGTCVGGNTGLSACTQDCYGDWGGTAVMDNCTTCVDGNTGLTACTQDCNTDWGGTAIVDSCGTCAGGNTGIAPVLIVSNCVTGIELNAANALKIYPNPFSNSFTIELSANISFPVTVEVLDYIGRQVHLQIIESNATEITVNSQLATGTYLVKVTGLTTQTVFRIVKIR